MSSRTIFFLSLPLLYLLSVPPVLVMVPRQDKIPHEWTEKYASGYFWLYENTPMRTPLEAYFNWCWKHMDTNSGSVF